MFSDEQFNLVTLSTIWQRGGGWVLVDNPVDKLLTTFYKYVLIDLEVNIPSYH